ncbi:hypothetical protein CYMTET_43508 [Cymbomonas tetramitiformis]|uniref:Uncharacterized protein n=1 Tax=Cymbomonas tetramitiformis TaxID=36881 RepID=A0AAE0F080_9CHLO|nr:hypothetical protein CYMTET_43508 [Cymbomonas tetramitiformis]
MLLCGIVKAAGDVALTSSIGMLQEEIIESFVELTRDDKFRRLTISQPKAVVARHEAWESRLGAILGRL